MSNIRSLCLSTLAAFTLTLGATSSFGQSGISTSDYGNRHARSAGAAVIKGADGTSMSFEGLADLEPIGNYYDGSTAELGSGPGPALGIVFSDNALAIIDQDAGGTGNFGGEPSPSTVMFFLSNTGTGGGAIMNVADGFVDGFSFFYTAVNAPGSITVYDDVDGAGNVLATLQLPVTASNGGDPTGTFSPFFPIGVNFAGTARSVDFGGTIDQIGFDNITLGSATPVGDPIGPTTPPETTIPVPVGGPWALLILIFALAGASGWFLRRG